MDYFNINFMLGFVGITAVIVVGNITTNIRVFALGLPILMTEVSFQLLAVGVMRSFNLSAPVRISSVPAGFPVRSGVYVMAEDIVAVDAGQGQEYRQQLRDRYLASKTIRALCWEMDLIWGVAGTVVGAGTMVCLFVVPDKNVGFILGKSINRSVLEV